MTVKVSDVMRHVRHHFIRDSLQGTFTHRNGTLYPAEGFAPGMWIAVTGENAPARVYQLDEQGGIPGLEERAWEGTVFRLDPPADFLRLCGDIGCWAAAHPDPAVSSEKLGDYSVSRQAMTWQTAFASALAPYMRMFPEVKV